MTVPADPTSEPALAEALEPELAAGGLKSATIRGTAWTAGSRVSQQLIQLAITVVLSRLLVPTEYGLVAMIAVFTGFAVLFVDSGFGAAVVQRQEVMAAHLSTAFWLNVAAGAAIAALAAAVAPLVALFYNQPRLVAIMPVAGLNFVLLSLGIVQLALLERRLMFRRIALVENASLAAAGAAGIGCAFAGLGVWSLVVFTLASNGIESFLLWLLSDWRPSRRFDRQAFHDLWGFGGGLLGSNAINYWNRNGDNLLIGRFVGPGELGLYMRAYSLVLLQLTQVSYVVGRTLFPALSRMQNDLERTRRAYLRAVGIVALLTFPIATGFVVLAKPLVLTLFGSRWEGVVPLAQILAVAAVSQAIATTTGVLYQAQGRTDWMLRWQAVVGATSLIAFGVGVHWGAKGVAVGIAVQSVLLLYPSFAIPGRLVGMRFLDVTQTVWRVLAAALISAAAAWGVGRALVGERHGLQLVAELAAAGLVYLACVHLARLEPYRDLRESLTRRRAAGSPAPAGVG